MAIPASFDRRELAGPFDIVGDVHGCCGELEVLLRRLGWTVGGELGGGVVASHPEGRTLIFVGDLVDRGPRAPDVLRVAMNSPNALCVKGNHDEKLARWLAGKSVKVGNGLQASIDQMSAETEAFRAEARSFIGSLPSHLWLDGGKLVVAHAGIKSDMIGRDDDRARAFTLYGDTSGEVDEFGYPVRRDWAVEYSGEAAVVYGHVAAPQLEWLNNTICLDTGCVFGGKLTALRWPERELVSVDASRVWYEAKRPLAERVRR